MLQLILEVVPASLLTHNELPSTHNLTQMEGVGFKRSTPTANKTFGIESNLGKALRVVQRFLLPLAA